MKINKVRWTVRVNQNAKNLRLRSPAPLPCCGDYCTGWHRYWSWTSTMFSMFPETLLRLRKWTRRQTYGSRSHYWDSCASSPFTIRREIVSSPLEEQYLKNILVWRLDAWIAFILSWPIPFSCSYDTGKLCCSLISSSPSAWSLVRLTFPPTGTTRALAWHRVGCGVL